MSRDMDKQIKAAEREIRGKLSTVVFSDSDTVIEIDGESYEVPKMVFNLVVDAIASNQQLVGVNQELRDYIARAEIMRGVS